MCARRVLSAIPEPRAFVGEFFVALQADDIQPLVHSRPVTQRLALFFYDPREVLTILALFQQVGLLGERIDVDKSHAKRDLF